MLWVEPDTRDQVVEFLALLSEKIHYSVKQLLSLLDIHSGKYYAWIYRKGVLNNHNAHIPKENWLFRSRCNKIKQIE